MIILDLFHYICFGFQLVATFGSLCGNVRLGSRWDQVSACWGRKPEIPKTVGFCKLLGGSTPAQAPSADVWGKGREGASFRQRHRFGFAIFERL